MPSNESKSNESGRSESLWTKAAAAVFATVIAPVLVAVGMKFSDVLVAPLQPKPPEAARAEPEKPVVPPAEQAKPEPAQNATARNEPARNEPLPAPSITGTGATTGGATSAPAAASGRSAKRNRREAAKSKPDDLKRPVGYTSLFNGRDLTGWESAQGGTVRWAVNAKNKAIVSVGAKRQGNWLFSDKDFSDFRLRLEFRIEPQSDSGIALRTPPLSNVKQGRMAIRLTSHSDDPIPTGTFVTWSGGAAHPQSTPQDRVSLRPANKWNAVEIEFRGSRLAVTINGQTIQDVNVDELARKSKAGGGLLEKTGRIGLECRSGHVEFRDIEIQEL